MGQYVDAEVKSAVGRTDVVIKMQEAIYVFEFKVDGTPCLLYTAGHTRLSVRRWLSPVI